MKKKVALIFGITGQDGSYLAEFLLAKGFVAQTGLRTGLPLPRTDLAYGHGTGYAKSCETVEDSGADLDFCDLTIEVARREALAK